VSPTKLDPNIGPKRQNNNTKSRSGPIISDSNIRRLDTLGQLGHHPGVDFARDDLLRGIQQPHRHVACTGTNLKDSVCAAYCRLRCERTQVSGMGSAERTNLKDHLQARYYFPPAWDEEHPGVNESRLPATTATTQRLAYLAMAPA
jgi:hypothetical protein